MKTLSSAFAQALTALSFVYKCKVFITDNGTKLFERGNIAGLKARTFDPLSELMQYYKDMGGQLLGCNPSSASQTSIRKPARRC